MKKKARNYWFILISIVMTLGFANSFAETLPVLNIKGNGQSGQVSLMPNDNLSVKLDIDPGTFAGIKADWWLVAKTPSGDWYSWVYPTGWINIGNNINAISVSHQGDLFSFKDFEVLNLSKLPTGNYDIYFGVDGNMNGYLDYSSLVYSNLKINVFPPEIPGLNTERMVIANRGSSSLSIIDVATDSQTSIDIPKSNNAAEPMYVNYDETSRHFYVGDRANNRVLILNANDYSFAGEISVGKGVFHQWLDTGKKQLWVNSDIDKTTSVIDLSNLKTLAVIPTPADISDAAGKPHDVFIDPVLPLAFVSYIGITGSEDVVVQFSTSTFKELARLKVGKDPHLFINAANPDIYIATQGGNAVYVASRSSLVLKTTLPVEGAHGIFMDKSGETVFVSDIIGSGNKAIWTIVATTNTVNNTTVDADFASPHNLALVNDKKLYVTHSGATANKVSVFDIPCLKCSPVLNKNITVGTNPFGLGFIK